MKLFTTSLILALALSPVYGADQDLVDVRARVQTAVNKILTTLKDKTLARENKKKEVMDVVTPLFDLKLMAKLVLGRQHWPNFNEEQKKEFTDLFMAQLQDSYFDKVDLLTDEKVEFGDAVRKKKKMHLPTYILSKDKRYEMIYKLYADKDEVWKVYDVEIEGISVVKSYSAQYDQFLKKNSPTELIVKLKEKALSVPDDLKAAKDTKLKKGANGAPEGG